MQNSFDGSGTAAPAAAGASVASEGAGATVGSINSMSIESGRTMMRVT
jgi:hypothetical protein